jgi:ElaB/YqjD/DUF883 family membrane-anchored ribosome-binding protein
MSTTTEKDLKELRSEYASLKSDLAEMSKTIANLANDGIDEGSKRVRSVARHSRDRARETLGAVENEIEERPITSVAVALGAGFVLGKLLSR